MDGWMDVIGISSMPLPSPLIPSFMIGGHIALPEVEARADSRACGTQKLVIITIHVDLLYLASLSVLRCCYVQ